MSGILNDLLLRAARREPTERTPVWLMRQAGRTDPGYLRLRERSGLPLEALFRHADLAAEISMLPKRLGVDAIIFFQDILTPLTPMGAEFVFRPGPVWDAPIRSVADIERLRSFDPSEKLGHVAEIIGLVKNALDGELPVMGFAGAPLTLAAFLIEGRSPGADPVHTHALMQDDPGAFHRLLNKLADMTAAYLHWQILAGADAVQLFESCADILTPRQYAEFAHPYHVHVLTKLARTVPTILFAREQTDLSLMAESGADVLSVGACVDLAEAKAEFGDRVAFQGNVDNRIVADGSLEEIDAAVQACIQAGAARGHILNLNHGLLQRTPFENVRRFVDRALAGHATATSPAQSAT